MSQKISKFQKLTLDRNNADQGEFFFAKVRMSNGEIIARPVFVIGKNKDSNDSGDVIVCSCTSEPGRSKYDKKVQLKLETVVRTNKIYTIGKDQLEFKIQANLSIEEIEEIISEANNSIALATLI